MLDLSPRAHTLFDAARILQQATNRLSNTTNRNYIAFKAFRGIYTVIHAKSVADDVPDCFQCPISHDWMEYPIKELQSDEIFCIVQQLSM